MEDNCKNFDHLLAHILNHVSNELAYSLQIIKLEYLFSKINEDNFSYVVDSTELNIIMSKFYKLAIYNLIVLMDGKFEGSVTPIIKNHLEREWMRFWR